MIGRSYDWNGDTKKTDLIDQDIGVLVDNLNIAGDRVDNLQALPLVAQGLAQIDLSNPGGFFTSPTTYLLFTHNLGYKPSFIVYLSDAGGTSFLPLPIVDWGVGSPPALARPVSSHVSAFSTSSGLYVIWHGQAQAAQQSFYYFLFNNPVSN
jgi:hypothetical protein